MSRKLILENGNKKSENVVSLEKCEPYFFSHGGAAMYGGPLYSEIQVG